MHAILVEDPFLCNPCTFLPSSFVHASESQLCITASLMGNAAYLRLRNVIMSGPHIAHGVNMACIANIEDETGACLWKQPHATC